MDDGQDLHIFNVQNITYKELYYNFGSQVDSILSTKIEKMENEPEQIEESKFAFDDKPGLMNDFIDEI